ncbi:hypothetical protein C8F01DRAFT_546449 [Mycena amicta]|nr:hypothetical protein C8F01DRAFT_546449 [Mycena amicta]
MTTSSTSARLAFCRARLAEIGQRLCSATGDKEGWLSEDSEVDDCYRELRLYIYPVNSLPNEIIFEIFVHYLPPYPSCPPLYGTDSPLVVAQVCKQWRSIAFNTPALWRAIELFEYGSEIALQASSVANYTQRSGVMPLSIVFCNLPAHRPALVAQALKSLVEHRARWEFAHLEYHTDEQPILHAPMPMLRGLSIYHRGVHLPDIWLATLPTLLRTVFLDLEKDHYLHLLRSPSLPWSQLTRLRVRHVSPAMVADVLREATGLLACCIEIETTMENSILPVVKHANLESLIISRTVHWDPECYPRSLQCLSMFRLPALRRLCFEAGEDAQDSASLSLAIKSVGCQLQELYLNESWWPDCDCEELSHISLVKRVADSDVPSALGTCNWWYTRRMPTT